MSRVFEFDTEFRDTSNKHITAVGAVICHDDFKQGYFTYNNPDITNSLKNRLKELEGHICTCYSAAAESRFMLSIGVDPKKYKWLDLWVAFRWYHNFPGCMKLQRTDLLTCCKDCNIRYLNPEQKEEMRDIILSGDTFESKDLRNRILDYCYQDTKVLRPLREKLVNKLSRLYKMPIPDVINTLLYLSKYSAYMGVCEDNGLPIDMDALSAIVSNAPKIRFQLIEKIPYPFYIWNAGKDDYSFKYEMFKNYLEINKLSDKWEKTDKGFYSTNKDVLEKNKLIDPAINALYETNKILSQLRSICSRERKEGLYEFIGTDNRVRARMFPFGTQSGRNSPKASQFPLGMSSVFRILVRPTPGRAITSIDWASQEFLLAAVLSGDEVMMQAYASGDPYVYFAKRAGAMPEEGTKKSHPKVRMLFKSTVLGLQYSLGVEKLSYKLTIDMGEKVSVAEAQKLVDLHKQVFKKYWRWVYKQDTRTKHCFVTKTLDNFAIVADAMSLMSMRNWPVQAAGAALMRKAVINAIDAGLTVLTPHHDAIYIEHQEGDDTDIKKLKECMDAAVKFYLKDAIIRCDVETHTHDQIWVEAKGEKTYEQLKDYFKKGAVIQTKYEPSPILEFMVIGDDGSLPKLL